MRDMRKLKSSKSAAEAEKPLSRTDNVRPVKAKKSPKAQPSADETVAQPSEACLPAVQVKVDKPEVALSTTLGMREYAKRYRLIVEQAYALWERAKRNNPELPPHTLPNVKPVLKDLDVFLSAARASEVCQLHIYQIQLALTAHRLQAYRRTIDEQAQRIYVPTTAEDTKELFFKLADLTNLKHAKLDKSDLSSTMPLVPITWAKLALQSDKKFHKYMGLSKARFIALQDYLEHHPPSVPLPTLQALIFTLFQFRNKVNFDALVSGTPFDSSLIPSTLAGMQAAFVHAPESIKKHLPLAFRQDIPGNEPSVDGLELILVNKFGSVEAALDLLSISLSSLKQIHRFLIKKMSSERATETLLATLELWRVQTLMMFSLSRRYELSRTELAQGVKDVELLIRQGRFKVKYLPAEVVESELPMLDFDDLSKHEQGERGEPDSSANTQAQPIGKSSSS